MLCLRACEAATLPLSDDLEARTHSRLAFPSIRPSLPEPSTPRYFPGLTDLGVWPRADSCSEARVTFSKNASCFHSKPA